MLLNCDVVKRKNVFAKNGEEFALMIKFLRDRTDSSDYWSVYSWDNQPKQSEIETIIGLVKRTCEIYHRHIKIPTYNLTVERM